MILIWSIPQDEPALRVYQLLKQQGHPVFFLDQRKVLDININLQFWPTVMGELASQGQKIYFEEIKAAYFRPYNFKSYAHFKELPIDHPDCVQASRIEEILWGWAEQTEAVVLNKASVMRSNHSKPYQMALIRALGFEVPETLISTSEEAVKAFAGRHKAVIYKSVSSVRSIVHTLNADKMRDLGNIKWCPTQFQAYVPGTDYRVHVVGDKLFCKRIQSEAIDYRYGSSQQSWTQLPAEIEKKCFQLSEGLALPLCGIDLRQTPEGKWICFEVNPSPAFTAFENKTHQPITQTVVNYLSNQTNKID